MEKKNIREENEAFIRDVLFTTLKQLLQEKNIDAVCTSDIIKISGIPRASFYRRFKDKYDCLNQCYQDLLNQSTEQYMTGLDWEKSMTIIYETIQRNAVFFDNAFTSSDVNSLRNYITRYGQNFHVRCLREKGVDVFSWEVRYLVKGCVVGSTEIMMDWIHEGTKQPVPHMVRLFREMIPTRYQEFY